jgi:hypothetical protein
VESQLADSKLYESDQAEVLHDLVRQQQNLKEEIELAEEQWLELTEQLEAS